MGCIYQYYKDSEIYYPKLYCKLDDKRCLYSKRCELKEKFIPLGTEDECYKYNLQKHKDLPEGSYLVVNQRKNKRGTIYAYVDYNGSNRRIEVAEEILQDYVYIKEENGELIASTTPFGEQ